MSSSSNFNFIILLCIYVILESFEKEIVKINTYIAFLSISNNDLRKTFIMLRRKNRKTEILSKTTSKQTHVVGLK